jgi:hypothetical protein
LLDSHNVAVQSVVLALVHLVVRAEHLWQRPTSVIKKIPQSEASYCKLLNITLSAALLSERSPLRRIKRIFSFEVIFNDVCLLQRHGDSSMYSGW